MKISTYFTKTDLKTKEIVQEKNTTMLLKGLELFCEKYGYKKDDKYTYYKKDGNFLEIITWSVKKEENEGGM